QTEMQLADALEFTERILTSAPIGILTYKFTGECLSANAYAAQMIGTTITGLKSQNFRELESWKKSGLYQLAEEALASRKLTASDIHILTTFGKEVWFQVQFVTFKSAGEELLLLIIGDITERKRTEEALRESEENYRQLFEAESDAIFLIENETGQILQANQAACVLYGYSQEELLAKRNTELSAEPEQTSQMTQETPLAPDQVINIPLRFHRKKDGTVFPVEITGRFFLHQGRPVHIAAVRDITGRRQAEAAVIAMQKHFQALIENAPDGIALLGLDGKLRQVTPSTHQILGYTPQEAKGQDPASVTHPEDLPTLLSLLSDLIQNPGKVATTQYRFRHKDGSWRWLESTISNLIDEPSVQAIVFNYRDITQSRQADEALREKDRLLSEAQRIGHIGSWSYDILTDTIKFSDEMYRLLDILPEEFQHNSNDFLSLTYPSDRALAARWMEEIKTGRQVSELDFRVFRKNGELLYIQCRGAVEFDSTGKPVHFIGMAQDITERKLADIQIHQQIRRLTALSEIDRAIISSFDQHYILGVILSQVTSQLQVDAADVLLLDPDEQMLDYAAGQGFRTKMVEAVHTRVDESHAGRVAKERRMVRISDLKENIRDPLFNTLVSAEGFVSYIGVPLIVKGRVKGVLEVFQRMPLQPYPEWLDFLNTLAGQAAIAIENATLFENLERSNLELSQAYDATIEGWSRAMDLRDRETEGHTQRVTTMTINLARRFGFSEEDLLHIRRGALLHDIGKMGVPDNILNKPTALTDEEWVSMHKHPQFAYDMLHPIEYLRPALDIPYCHHEKWDGTGYPRGLKGEEIPMAARLFAIIDVWDALISDRPYRPAWSQEEALTHLREQSGTHFDPQVVELFFKILM
ncbi:MAG: PAS domain S-box protein, partial [Chloroflexi bacterium]